MQAPAQFCLLWKPTKPKTRMKKAKPSSPIPFFFSSPPLPFLCSSYTDARKWRKKDAVAAETKSSPMAHQRSL
jgi:hypothetical protein